MTSKLLQNPKRRVPDWRITLPLAQASPRCGARTRTGMPCRAPAMACGKCSMHGGASTGPRTAEGLERIRKARTTHGRRTAEMDRMRAMVRLLMAGREAAGGPEMMTAARAEMHGACRRRSHLAGYDVCPLINTHRTPAPGFERTTAAVRAVA